MKIKELLLERGYNAPGNGNVFFWDFYALYELWYKVGSGYSGTKSSSSDANVHQFYPDFKIPNEKRSRIIDDIQTYIRLSICHVITSVSFDKIQFTLFLF